MTLRPELIEPPRTPAVSIDELKQHLQVRTTDDDALLKSLVMAAQKHLEGWGGILRGVCFVEQTWSHSFESFPCGESWRGGNSGTMQNVLRFKFEPVIELDSIKYYDASGVLQTSPIAGYRVLSDALGSFVSSIPGAPTPWPSSTQGRPDAVIVEAIFGYGSRAADVPEPIRTAICMKVARMYSLSRLSISNTSRFVRSETVDGIGSQTFGSGSEAVQIMQQNTEAEERLLGPYRRSFFA